MELSCIGPDDFLPAVDADDLDGIDQGMALKPFQCVEQDRLVVDGDELLGDALPHTGTGSAGDNNGYVHFRRILL